MAENFFDLTSLSIDLIKSVLVVFVALTADGEMIEGIEGGQGAQLIVFGDPNSKRAVQYMKTVDVK